MHAVQLHIVPADTHEAGAAPKTAAKAGAMPLERVFGHWVFMLGKNPKRCALGPTRKRAIERALGLYDEETLQLAIEGCAASAWHAGENDRGREFNDIELILRDEAHIERFAADGERLRDRVLAAAAAERQAAEVPAIAAAEPAAVAANIERLRAMAARLAGRRLSHG
jgi:hypothetical protein